MALAIPEAQMIKWYAAQAEGEAGLDRMIDFVADRMADGTMSDLEVVVGITRQSEKINAKDLSALLALLIIRIVRARQATPDSGETFGLIHKTLTGFAWWNYGLDNVGEAKAQDWARDLAAEITTALGGA